MIGRFAAAWIGRLAATCLLMAAPAAGQTRVYTNADLGQPLTWAACPDARGARLGCRTAVRTDAGGSGRPQGDDHRRRPVARAIWRVCAVGNPAARSQLARGHMGLLGDGVAPRYRAGQPYSAGGLGMNRRHGGGRMYSLGEPRVTAPSPFMRPGSHQPPPPPAPRNAADREQCRGGLAVAAEASRTTVALSRPSSAGPSLEAPADVRPRAPAVH
jgi:hypothetical protein